MSELIRPSTVLPANRQKITIHTEDGLNLIGEVATPLKPAVASLLCLHPLPTHGGMMDSHIFKKAANRLPALADIAVLRFNTRGTASEAGKSDGEFGNGESEKYDVAAAIAYAFDILKLDNLWVIGWSFGTELALAYAKDPRIKGLILLSPPLRRTTESELSYWNVDGRPIIALVPEFDEFLKPIEAKLKFSVISQAKVFGIDGAKHLWVGEPFVYIALTEILKIINPAALPLPLEI